MDYFIRSTEVTKEDILRHATNDAEFLGFLLLFFIFILIMFWHMQIFRRVFRVKGSQCIINPQKLILVHSLIVIYLMAKIISCGYGLIAGRVDFENKKQGDQVYRYYNINVYTAMLSFNILTQMTAYIINITNWIQIINRLNEKPILRRLINMSIPLIVITLIGQIMLNLTNYLSDQKIILQLAVALNILTVFLIQFLAFCSWYIYKFFTVAYAKGYFLNRAVIYLNLGLQLKFVWIVVGIFSPEWLQSLKSYNPTTQRDETVTWAFIWCTEQIIFSVVPTVFLIILIRPVLFITATSGVNSVYKSLKRGENSQISQVSASNGSQLKSFSMNHEELDSVTITSNSEDYQRNVVIGFSKDSSGFFETTMKH